MIVKLFRTGFGGGAPGFPAPGFTAAATGFAGAIGFDAADFFFASSALGFFAADAFVADGREAAGFFAGDDERWALLDKCWLRLGS